MKLDKMLDITPYYYILKTCVPNHYYFIVNYAHARILKKIQQATVK